MVAGVFAELAAERPRRRFTIGINDDVSGTSLRYDATLDIEPPETVRAVFFGLGSDGTVGANKNTIKILGDEGLHAQGYFVYDSKKSGSQTVSHLRFGPQPIRAAYLVQQASFVGCHQFGLLDRVDVLGAAADGATLLLNCPRPPDQVWDALSRPTQEQILAKHIDVYTIDAGRIAREVGLAGRTNIVLQTCFFALSGVMPREQAIERIKASVAQATAVAAPRWSSATRLRSTARSTDCTGSTVPSRQRRPANCRRSSRHTRPNSFGRSQPRCSPAAATTCRSARCRWTGPTRAAPRPTRSATSRSSSPSGTPTCASSAATAASSARTA